jgi:hypothetical protein
MTKYLSKLNIIKELSAVRILVCKATTEMFAFFKKFGVACKHSGLF